MKRKPRVPRRRVELQAVSMLRDNESERIYRAEVADGRTGELVVWDVFFDTRLALRLDAGEWFTHGEIVIPDELRKEVIRDWFPEIEMPDLEPLSPGPGSDQV